MFQSGIAGHEAGNKNIDISLNWIAYFLKVVKDFYHMFIDNFVHDDLEEFAWLCARGDLGLVGALS